ncbi:MAG: 5-oxoprolinase subunit PxpB [Flavobacteriaceae bacterium]|nr:MAG: 5-oxoprolinase subunit PxpB [Flavobacteriaceae bacterium]
MSKNLYQLTYKPFGDSAILIEWPAKTDEKIIKDIIRFESIISNNQNNIDTIIAYHSLTVKYQNSIDFDFQISQLKELYLLKRENQTQKQRIWQIPVCYDMIFGPDLGAISKLKRISIAEIIQLHTSPDYLIYFLGFQPGFLYLGGLHTKIHMPRKPNPRLRVAKGTVGIGGAQTGVYPQDSAGGWNLIGKSPVNFFDVTKSPPCFAKAGDRVRFHAIDLETFYEVEEKVKQGVFQLKFQEL